MAPRELAFGWDNVGQLLGDPNQKVEKVLVHLISRRQLLMKHLRKVAS
jgi:putative NIF3 family GTP cyclohydrolase 1 type 2